MTETISKFNRDNGKSFVKSTVGPYHIFTRFGQYFVFDTTGCRFYKIDEITYCYLQYCLKYSIDETEVRLLQEAKFSSEAIKNVKEEVSILAQNGLFDIPDYFMADDEIDKLLDSRFGDGTSELTLILTDKCNLACKYCYCATSRDINSAYEGPMNEEIALKAVDWLFDNCGTHEELTICFFGGEPLLNKPVLYSVVEYADSLAMLQNKKISYTMTSNVTLVDDELAEYLKNHHIKVLISLDGPKHIHDAQCPTQGGMGSFDMAKAGAERIIKNQEHTTARCTLTHPIPNIKELVSFFRSMGFSDCYLGITTNPIYNPSSSDFQKSDYESYHKQNEMLLPEMLEELRKNGDVFYDPYRQDLSFDNAVPVISPIKCGACRNCLTVSSKGDLYPCHHFIGMKAWRIGNIYEPPAYEQYKLFWKKYRKALKFCEQCWAAPICQGPCPADIMKRDGDFYDYEIEFCKNEKINIECRAYIWSWKYDNNLASK